ncbi:hypothetical protein [Natronoglomus mannanivorans]|uniref:Fibronectin type-III domain-containing protein n=1 Tax=Natronoglomus mannanivorans TaxID=2979990 RepID=A0AAP2Z0U7_9EURY|nr:hypothetical protein [Halobacteria archaeon AArc-xg1-1]
MQHNRRTFLRTVGAGSLGTVVATKHVGATVDTGITIDGAGEDIWNDADAFHYYFDDVEGDFDAVVRVDSIEATSDWAKAGLMVRDGLAAGAANAMIRTTPGHDTSVQWRSSAGADAVSTTSDGGEAQSEVAGGTIDADWQRLVREGDTLSAYASSDGDEWTLVAELSSGEVSLGDSVSLGLAVTSHNPGTLCEAEFSELAGVEPAYNDDVGLVEVAGNVSVETDPTPGPDPAVSVSTGSASAVTTDSATLSGSLDVLEDVDSATVHFEYRERATSAWNETDGQTLSSAGSFDADVTGLSADTEYEFRAVAVADDVSDTGSTTTFTTDEPSEPGIVTVEGAGEDIWNDADEFHYYFTEVSGDFDAVVHVDDQEDTDGWAKSGLMVRESLEDDATNAMVRTTPGNDTSVSWRPETGADAGSTTSDLGEDLTAVDGGTLDVYWQRLVRTGDTIRAYGAQSPDDWTLIVELTEDEIDLSDDGFLGLAVTSASPGTLCATEFSSLTGVEPTHNQDVGDVDVAGSVTDTGGDPIDVDPLVLTDQPTDVGETTVTAHGTLEAMGNSDSVAVGFEYRRVGASTWQETAIESLSSAGSFSRQIDGLDHETEYEIRAVAVGTDGQSDDGLAITATTLGPDSDPIVHTGDISNVSPSSATLTAFLEDVGGHATSAEVFAEIREVGASDWIESDRQTLESGEEFVVTMTGLTPETEYEVRAAAVADDGDTDIGEPITFTTPEADPVVSTDSATAVTGESATLNGSVDLGGASSAAVSFEYREVGDDEWAATDPETRTSSGTFSRTVGSLSSQADHEFRAVVEIDGDVREGSVETFTTEERDPVAEGRVTVGNIGANSPSSELAPNDGFADTSWIADEEFVVLRVTNLDATGEGSLKWAIESNLGDIGLEEEASRLIVFEVGGVIDLQNTDIDGDSRKNIYVAGQTAPPPGITIIRSDKPGVEFDEANQFVQHIRSMPGDQTSDAADAMVAGDNAYNVCFDHCSVFFGTEESMSVNAGSDSADITFSNNIMALPLFDAPVHSDPTRAYGTLFGNGMDRGAILGNLYAHTWSRNPRLKGGTEAMVANNVWYNFENGMRIGDDQDDPNYVNSVGNRYIAGEAADFDQPIVYTEHDESDPPIHIYLADNEYDDGYTLIDEDDVWEIEDEPIDEYWPDNFSPMDGDPLEHALSNAGARPAERIDLEEQVLADVQNGTGEIIDSQDEVGGYPDLPSTTRELEIPDGDITDWLIQHTRAVELGEEPPN